MTVWTRVEHARLKDSESLRLFADTTSTLFVEVGMVILESGLYVRAFRGPSSIWFRAALTSKAGRIEVAEWTRTVAFERVAATETGVDDAYAAKYGSAAALVTATAARNATLRLVPAERD